MKGILVYLFGALGLGWLADGAAGLIAPDFGAGRGFLVAGISMAVWIPFHRWLTRPEPAPCDAGFGQFADGDHPHHCTQQGNRHTWHSCECGMRWQPSPITRIIPYAGPPLTAAEAAAFQAKWRQAHTRRNHE